MFNFFGFFTKKEKQKEMEQHLKEGEEKSKDDKYSDAIIEVTRILTNGDKHAIVDMSLLSRNHEGFIEKYKAWCEEMIEDTSDKRDVVPFLMAYWLAGHDTGSFEPSYRYGYYIDWKEATEDILWGLKEPVEKLGYPLDFKEIVFTGEEFTDEALQMINDFCLSKGYSLVSYDTCGDCYHLFIVKADDVDRLVALGEEMDIKFSNEYV